MVTDQNAKALAQPPQPKGSRTKPGAKTPQDPAAAGAAAGAIWDPSAPSTDPAKRSVRTVGPPFVSAH